MDVGITTFSTILRLNGVPIVIKRFKEVVNRMKSKQVIPAIQFMVSLQSIWTVHDWIGDIDYGNFIVITWHGVSLEFGTNFPTFFPAAN